jgi:hypothetical protein
MNSSDGWHCLSRLSICVLSSDVLSLLCLTSCSQNEATFLRMIFHAAIL